MAMDGNRDGVIEFDKDEDRQSVFWINNDRDAKHYNENMWQEDDLNEGTPNCDDDTIGNGVSIPGENPDDAHYTEDNCLRDLEDFTRLHVRIGALPAGMPADGITCWMRFENVTEGDPKINVFKAITTGDDYLKYPEKANEQVKEKALTSTAINKTMDVQIDMQHIKLNGLISPFLIEGCSPGTGDLTIVLKKERVEIVKTSVRISLKDITYFYDVYEGKLDFSFGEWLPVSYQAPQSERHGGYQPETEEEFLFVHGWNMDTWEKKRWAETVFKRLWWQGYKGRVSSFEWPTLAGFGSNTDIILQLRHFDNSEFRAWLCGEALANLISSLKTKGSLRIMAHSMGNVVAGEALRLQQSDIPHIHTYLACQAALSAQYYGDEKDKNPCEYQSLDITFPGTPDVMGKYRVQWENNIETIDAYFENHNSVANMRNWYNGVDWALDHWEKNNVFKPDNWGIGYGFGYMGTVFGNYTENLDRFYRSNDTLKLTKEKERYMIFSHAAESRSRALGQISKFGFENWDLKANMGYDKYHYSHSRQFRSNVVDEWLFWVNVVEACGLVNN
jgi:hypothetical protein